MAQTQIVDKAGNLWSVRRTSIDTPQRAYHIRRLDNARDAHVVLPGVLGFYAESIDDAKHKLNV
jgi:hypothetical protein